MKGDQPIDCNMRFVAFIVNRSGQLSSRRAIIPGNFVRFDDGEQFRIYCENEWDIPGVVRFVYDAKNNPDAVVHEVSMEAGDILSPEVVYTYERTAVGEGRLLEIEWTGKGRNPFPVQYMMINNDFRGDNPVKYGDVFGDDNSIEIVPGLNKDPAKDPDRHRRANAPVYNATEFDVVKPPQAQDDQEKQEPLKVPVLSGGKKPVPLRRQ